MPIYCFLYIFFYGICSLQNSKLRIIFELSRRKIWEINALLRLHGAFINEKGDFTENFSSESVLNLGERNFAGDLSDEVC